MWNETNHKYYTETLLIALGLWVDDTDMDRQTAIIKAMRQKKQEAKQKRNETSLATAIISTTATKQRAPPSPKPLPTLVVDPIATIATHCKISSVRLADQRSEPTRSGFLQGGYGSFSKVGSSRRHIRV